MIRLLCLLLLCATFAARADGLVARVDRSELTPDETLELVVEAEGATLFGKPDFAPLEADFVVMAPRQVNELSTAAGRARALTRWQVTLQPRRTGELTIPSLALGDWRSAPIRLRVLASDARRQAAGLAPVFIDASVDRQRLYVQAQAILTLRIYHSVSLYDDSTLSPLQMNDALVERLGEAQTYERTLDDVRHGVIEVRYAIYPQRSGRITIPGQVFSATAAAAPGDGQRSGVRPGRPTQVSSPPITLEVLPRPAAFPADAPWIPATNLTLGEVWSDHGEVRVGDSLTRSLMIQAEGLSAAQLPPVATPAPEGVRVYPDQPTLSNQIGVAGLTGTREQSDALVPSRPGRMTLPDTEVLWWNTEEDRLERTRLPGRALQVAVNPALAPTLPPPPEGLPPPPGALLWPWQLATALLALGNLFALALWWRARRQPAVLRTASDPTARNLLDDLRRACQANDSQATRQALDAWARQQPETLAEMAARHVPLSDALDGLNGALYSESGQRWQGHALWLAINSLPPLEQPTPAEPGALPPLYPKT